MSWQPPLGGWTTAVSPSPQELFARLDDAERIAIDLILQDGHEDPRLVALVPDEKRRGYLGTLAMQLRALGVTLTASHALDEGVKGWEEACRRDMEGRRRRTEEQAAQAAEQRRRDDALPPEVRRAVQRRRRRQARRQGTR